MIRGKGGIVFVEKGVRKDVGLFCYSSLCDVDDEEKEMNKDASFFIFGAARFFDVQ
jgi:hypothetical protein